MPILMPDVDMLLVSKTSREQRKSITGIAPQIGLKIVDYGRLFEIDQFYLKCQDYRDFYRDPRNKVLKPDSFKAHFGRCSTSNNDVNTWLLQQPTVWKRQYPPIIYPIDYGHGLNVGTRPHLSGQYSPTACFRYKQ